MTTFDDRKDGFENKFVHDEALRFRAYARRNKLLGLWAAEKFGLSGDEANEYAMSVVRADVEEVGDDDVLRKVKGDFDERGISQSEHQIRRTMDELLGTAVQQVQNEG